VADESPLVPMALPALLVLLLAVEKEKGRELRKEDVLAVRDQAVFAMVPARVKAGVEASRGYVDIDPDHVWMEWQERRQEFYLA
jgi:hypothetical protein